MPDEVDRYYSLVELIGGGYYTFFPHGLCKALFYFSFGKKYYLALLKFIFLRRVGFEDNVIRPMLSSLGNIKISNHRDKLILSVRLLTTGGKDLCRIVPGLAKTAILRVESSQNYPLT